MGRALISDFEVLSPLGNSVAEFASALFSAKSGITDLNGRYGRDFPVSAAGFIKGYEEKREPVLAAQNLVRRVLEKHSPAPIDGLVFFIPQDDELGQPPVKAVEAILGSTILEMTGSPVGGLLSIHEACVSGLTGLALAAQRIRHGIWKRALVVGVDLRVSPLDLLRFHALGALSRRPAAVASCPFSLERDGFVRAQGGAAFLLEAECSSPWGEIAGWGQTADAWRLTEARADGAGARRAIEKALSMSGLRSFEIDCFSAHATSTIMGDTLEARLIKDVFGRIPVTALKSQLGHTGQAAGLLQCAAALMMKKEECLAPTINFQSVDPRCDLDCVPNSARPARVRKILCNATAFGGQNAALVVV